MLSVFLPVTPDTVIVPFRIGGTSVVTDSCAAVSTHRPSYVLLLASRPTRFRTSLTTQLLPEPFTCTQPDKAVRADPPSALPSASRASFVYPRYKGSATADRIPTIRMTISSSTRVNPASLLRPNSFDFASITIAPASLSQGTPTGAPATPSHPAGVRFPIQA